jgi:hypothetical protein
LATLLSTIARGDQLMVDRVCERPDPCRNSLSLQSLASATPGARGYEYIEIVADGSEYTSAFSCELVRLGPGDHSLTHV